MGFTLEPGCQLRSRTPGILTSVEEKGTNITAQIT